MAEKYLADDQYEPGTVVSFGGEKEVTLSAIAGDSAVAGVVSTNPAYIMNSGLEGQNVVAVALVGRVPCKVQGPITKGALLVSAGGGHARVLLPARVRAGRARVLPRAGRRRVRHVAHLARPAHVLLGPPAGPGGRRAPGDPGGATPSAAPRSPRRRAGGKTHRCGSSKRTFH
mgnify:CR=1 FL=1